MNVLVYTSPTFYSNIIYIKVFRYNAYSILSQAFLKLAFIWVFNLGCFCNKNYVICLVLDFFVLLIISMNTEAIFKKLNCYKNNYIYFNIAIQDSLKRKCSRAILLFLNSRSLTCPRGMSSVGGKDRPWECVTDEGSQRYMYTKIFCSQTRPTATFYIGIR